ncbi:MAG: redoxin domain-containing protein [Pirellulaceae bacterium]|nr:redoxin domain-containing protein [Pirellulaceae bacterium]
MSEQTSSIWMEVSSCKRALLGSVILLWLGAVVSAAGFREEIAGLLPTESALDEPFTLDSQAKYYVFTFLGVECPVARQYGAKLQSLADRFQDRGVQFIGINSNPQDSKAELAKYQREVGVRFAMLKDPGQQVAKRFSATRTAEVVVVDAQGKVQYRGRIDDQYSPGVARSVAESHDLRDALDSLTAGLPVAIVETKPVGCLITYPKQPSQQPTVTFTKDVAPLLYQHCYECHRSGEIGPFDISDYDDLLGWGEMLVEVMEQKRMPPWHASPEYGSFRNERHLPADVLPIVRRWIDEGMAYGDTSELPAKPKYTDGWRLPQPPEMVFEMRNRPYRVPADKTIDYQYFVVDPGFTEDKWVSASQIIPGASSVVHHAIVFVRPPDGGDFVGIGWLNAYVPGQVPVIYPPGYARKIAAGSKLVFQMHYTPSGTEQLDITKIGLNFMDASQVTHQVYTLVAIDQDFEIPPHAPNHTVVASAQRLPKHGELLSISPHMHLRGKAFEVFTKQGAVTQTILKVPHYDFNWQHTYEYNQPIPLNEIDDISITATFDNSKDNPFNPNPDEFVMWGDQTWEEMTLAYLDVAVSMDLVRFASVVREFRVNTQNESTASNVVSASTSEQSAEELQLATAFAEEFMAKHDRNGDGALTRSEVPTIFGDYAFWSVDRDYDQRLTREELIQAFRESRDRSR